MANHLHQLLDYWYPRRDEQQWVLATIIETDGSSYRKAGAMMMINDLGRYHGLLSGGCLESDIMRQARRCWENGRNRIIQYDMREEEDLAWQLGIGCGGMVRILLQPVASHNEYLYLDQVRDALHAGQSCQYSQIIGEGEPVNSMGLLPSSGYSNAAQQVSKVGDKILHRLTPAVHLAVFGGGVDAKPLVKMARDLGWRVTLVDPRTSYARESEFDGAHQIIKTQAQVWRNDHWLQKIDAAMIMNHNVELDALALSNCQHSSAKVVGLLGPVHRTDRVLDTAQMTRADLLKPLSNPVGLRLGGEVPESIALSILSEFHALMENADGASISGMLCE